MATQNQPLLSEVNTPAWPNSIKNSDITLKEHEGIKLSCPNDTKSSNVFQLFPGKHEIIAQCDTQDKLIIEGKTYRYSDLQCRAKVEPLVTSTREQCSGPHSEMIRVGFAVNGFLNAYSVCYDRSLHVPLYANTSKIYRGSGVDTSKFKWTPALGLGDEKPTGFYSSEGLYQKSKENSYEKGQLVNANDLAFGPAQAATFKENLNSVAVWNPWSNRTSWQEFEREIRRTSLKHKKWFTWTGASDYVSKDGGLVPRYLWKVINHDNVYSVMVYINVEFPTATDRRCSDKCDSIIKSPEEFLYCCNLDEFSKAFGISTHNFDL